MYWRMNSHLSLDVLPAAPPASLACQVGILLFLSEFFSDQLLAFMVLSMVWAAEVYSVITVRHHSPFIQ